MHVKSVIAAMSVALVWGMAVGQPVNVTGIDAVAALANIADALERDQVARVEVVHIPTRILTRTRISPEMLEAGFHYKFVIRELRETAYWEETKMATQSLSVHSEEQLSDLRWGVVFYGPDESRIAAIYFDGSGDRGAVNGIPVSFRGDLFRLLKRRFSQSFR